MNIDPIETGENVKSKVASSEKKILMPQRDFPGLNTWSESRDKILINFIINFGDSSFEAECHVSMVLADFIAWRNNKFLTPVLQLEKQMSKSNKSFN